MRLKSRGVLAVLSLSLILFAAVIANGAAVEFYDLEAERWMPAEKAVEKLRLNRVVLVGEVHDRPDHHAKQLGVIQALHKAGVDLGVGMEMFRRETQPELDRWTAGKSDATDFIKVYYDNWNYPWPLYGHILEFARDERIPILGLNVARDITNQVARGGFESLTEEQRGRLPKVTCRVDSEYMSFIRRAYGMRGHGNFDFTNFCEAQLVWDKSMAIHALDFLYANPDHVMVILAGNGHVWRLGIPDQIHRRAASMTQAVILPFIPGALTPENITNADADYLVRLKE
ncbi:MAG: ChaN family lipoprotein [Desulfococcaceae bacterium]